MSIKKISSYYIKEISLVDKLVTHFLRSLTSREKLELLDIKAVLLSLQLQMKRNKISHKIKNLYEKFKNPSSEADLEKLMKALKTFCRKG